MAVSHFWATFMFLGIIQIADPCRGSPRVKVKVFGTTVGPSYHRLVGKSKQLKSFLVLEIDESTSVL